jgi:hypothetical protein
MPFEINNTAAIKRMKCGAKSDVRPVVRQYANRQSAESIKMTIRQKNNIFNILMPITKSNF